MVPVIIIPATAVFSGVFFIASIVAILRHDVDSSRYFMLLAVILFSAFSVEEALYDE
jgi:uncharacterized membrane protein YozB (DUF420 family)